MVKVSVIIPVYNAGQYLCRMLSSICRQTLKEIEIICVDDGSADGSWQILERYAKKDSRVHVLEQKHAGAGAARNKGMEIAQGKYLAILDADDFFEKDMLEKAYRACERDTADICVFGADSFHTKTGRYQEIPDTLDQKLLPHENPFTPEEIYGCAFQAFHGWSWDKLYRRELVVASGLKFQKIRTSNDAFFVFLMNLQAKKITVLYETLAHHRIHVKTSLSVTREKSWDCCWQAVLAIQNELKARGQYDLVEQSFINWALHFLLWNVHSMRAGEARKNLYGKMRGDYFVTLELQKYPKNYFYDRNEYQEYKNICQPDSLKRTLRQLYIRVRKKVLG